MKSLIFFLALALVIIHAVGLRQFAQLDTETAIELRSAAQLNDDLAEIEVDAEYRDATLRGRVDSLEAKQRAEELVRNIIPTGRSRLRNEIEVAQDRASSVIASMADGMIDISGFVPSATLHKQFEDAAKALGKGRNFQTGGLQVDSQAVTENWLSDLPDFVKAFLGSSSDGRIEATQLGLRLEGEFKTQNEKDQVMRQAHQMLPSSRIFDDTTVVGPQAASLFVSRTGGKYKVGGTLPATSAGNSLTSNLVEWDNSARVLLDAGVTDAAWVGSAWDAINGFFSEVQGNAAVAIDAEKVEVKGEVLSAGRQAQALKWFNGGQWKTLKMSSDGLVVRQPKPFKLEIASKGGAITIGGTGSKAQEGQIMDAVKKTGATVTGKIDPVSGIQFPNWWKAFPELVQQFHAQADDAKLSILNDRITIEGRMKPGADEAQFKKQIASIAGLPSPNITGLKWPTLNAPALALTRGEKGNAVLSGTVATKADADRIAKAIETTAPKLNVKNELKVGKGLATPKWVSEFPAWWKVVSDKVPEAGISIRDDRVQLKGQGADPDKLIEVAGLMKKTFGDKFSYNYVPMEDMAVAKTAPRLILKRGKTGIDLIGEVANAKQRSEIIEAVRTSEQGIVVRSAQLKPNSVVEEVSWVADFPTWWTQLRSKVNDPAFEMDGKKLKLTGVVGSPAANQQLAGWGDSTFGKNILDRSQVTVPKSGPPSLSIRDNGSSILIGGVVQTPQQAKEIADIIRAKNRDVKSNLAVNPFVTTPTWITNFRGWWPNLLRNVKSPSLSFKDGLLSVEGTAVASGLETQAEKLLVTAFGKDLKNKSFNISVLMEAQPAQLSLAKVKNDWILSGRVPTEADKKQVLDAVKKTDPKVKDQVSVVASTTRPEWLSQFPNWWPKYRKDVPDGGFAAVGDEDPAFDGRLANRGSEGNAANLLADVFGGKKMKFDWQMPTLKRPRLSLKRDANGVILEGMVPTAKHRTDVENTVKKTEAKVTNRIAVDPDVDAPGWLESFGQWWPRLRKDIPDATFTLDDENNSKIGGEADEATSRSVGSFLAGFFGSGIKLPKLETRMPAPTKAPWLSFKADKSSIVVSGEVADEKARQQILSSLSKHGGKIDDSGLRITSSVKPESWTGNAGNYVVQLVAAAGPSTLSLRDRKAEVDATLPSQGQRNEFYRSLGRIVGSGFRIEDGLKVGSTPSEKTDLVLKDLLQGQRIYFPKNSSYFNSTERSKIQRFAREITNLKENDITVYLIGHADARGQTDYNQWLSDKRANRVSRALSSYGVKASFVRVEAKGERDAAPLKAGESAWSKDRRVDIRVGKTK